MINVDDAVVDAPAGVDEGAADGRRGIPSLLFTRIEVMDSLPEKAC